MPIDQDYINQTCNSFTKFVKEIPPHIDIKYIFHRRGQRDDAIELEKDYFCDFTAGRIALKLLREEKRTQNSIFYGLAIQTTESMMGLKENKNILGVITINLDNHEDNESVLHEAYHLGWMAIDTSRLLEHKKYKHTLKSGSLLPSRSALNIAKASLQADVFSSLVLASQGLDSMITRIAKERCMDTLLPKIKSSPWNNPYPLAYETTKEAWDSLIDTKKRDYHFIRTPLDFSRSIGLTIPDENYQQWWDFCEPAQSMAWHGERPEYILSAAEHTSEDPIIKVTANLLKTCTNINTSKDMVSNDICNEFISHEQNREYSTQLMENTFETILEEGIEAKSKEPFIAEAHKQNKNLTNGKVFGWCASALFTAANSYDLSKDRSDDYKRNLIKLGFEGAKKEINYDSLIKLGEKIIEHKKQGNIVTIESIRSIAKSQVSAKFVSEAITKTINDPAYQKDLSATQDMNSVYTIEKTAPKQQAAPSTPDLAPKAVPNIASGMGGGMMGGATSAPITESQPSEESKEKAE